MKNPFSPILKGKVVVVGIGNVLRGDDGFGPKLVENLSGSANAVCIDAQSTPENFIGKITKESPDTILIVDAVHINRLPGEYEVLKKSDITKGGFSTHTVSPAMFIDFLEGETNARIHLLGVQPQDVTLGADISDEVGRTLKEVGQLIKDALNA